ncbi:hypothetical protein K503DRAFT_835261 [Rhizopogon vinicolor AM-OR11-026]|uniref:Uncharacterized protein n=1 Tax=Rhizopogon vinicolor AM-OR11-026 TaxID=1314800 RepID=A0A1B7MN94_9AGAM|nr:hypothetical protein K503DRAFT_835261 [Rhizopogon vinicolor AM-OR11-026]
MSVSTGIPSCASTESPLPLVSLQHTSSVHASMTDGTSLPSIKQSPLNPSNCVIIIQNNCIAAGGTINIFSSHCTGSEDSTEKQAVVKLDNVAPTAEPTLLQPPLVMPEPVEYGRDSIIFSGNSLGECVMINVQSPNCIELNRPRPKPTAAPNRRSNKWIYQSPVCYVEVCNVRPKF